MKKLAIIVTHPIQYYAPVFKLLAQTVDIKVFYTWGEQSVAKYDPGFGKTIQWDIDLLEGYNYQWVKNTAPQPGSHHFNGIINPDLISTIESWQPDAVLVYGWAYKSHLKVMRYFKGKTPVFFRGDSTLLDEKPGLKNLLRSVYLKWIYKHIDHAFYNGINNKAYFKKYGLQENQLSFAPHAVDNDRFATDKKDEVILLKQTLGLTSADCLIVFAGKLEEKKDPGLLLNAFIQLEDPTTHLLFVGNGILENNLRSITGGYKNIHFIDFQNQQYMPVIYQSADLFCLPSKGPAETWGLAVNEAMACSKAILISDKVGCGNDLVKNGINGYIFKSEDAAELLTCLKLLTTDKSKLTGFGKSAGLIIEPWSFSNIARAIKDKLNE
jgi:glycosyltransferase involved in cell wall biosynthesis